MRFFILFLFFNLIWLPGERSGRVYNNTITLRVVFRNGQKKRTKSNEPENRLSRYDIISRTDADPRNTVTPAHRKRDEQNTDERPTYRAIYIPGSPWSSRKSNTSSPWIYRSVFKLHVAVVVYSRVRPSVIYGKTTTAAAAVKQTDDIKRARVRFVFARRACIIASSSYDN